MLRTSIFRPALSTSKLLSPTVITATRNFHNTNIKMAVTQLNGKQEFTDAIASGVSVVDFFATWCGPCKAISPQVEKFSNEYNSINFYKIDVDEVAEVAADAGVKAMPTFIIYKDGQKVEEVVGANPAGIKAALDKLSG